MIKLILIGILSGALFSTTFIINEIMSIAGGHWYWSGLLRYLFMILLLSIFVVAHKGIHYFKALSYLFYQHCIFWFISGSIGFGAFYALLCFSADYSPGWIIAATWQCTIVAGLLILLVFGHSFPKKIWFFSFIIFSGVILVNYSQIEQTDIQTLLLGAIPVLLAAFCYPLGNQLVWEASNGSNRMISISSSLANDTFNKILLMSLGSLPLWIILYGIVRPPLPNTDQALNSFYIAILSGIAATGLFLYGRSLAKSASELAAIDSTQSSQVVFALLGGIVFLDSGISGIIPFFGLALIAIGIVLFLQCKPNS